MGIIGGECSGSKGATICIENFCGDYWGLV